MQKEKITISETVMEKIHTKHVVMKPKLYFIFGSIVSLVGLIFSFITSIFLISLTRFALKTHGPMWQYRFEEIITSFPWWAPVFGILAIVIGMKLLRSYDFSYKRNFLFIMVGIITALYFSFYIIDKTGLEDQWFTKGPMRGIFRGRMYQLDDSVHDKPKMRRYR